MIGGDIVREEWKVEAQHRESWRDIAREAAKRNEETIYKQLEKRHQKRIAKPARRDWEAMYAPLQKELIGLALTITASLDEHTFETALKFYKDHASFEDIQSKSRVNVFHLAKQSKEIKQREDKSVSSQPNF